MLLFLAKKASNLKLFLGGLMLEKEELAKNVLQILQTKPEKYKTFGVYWWFIKAIVKEYYNQDNLYMLGDYVDSDMVEELAQISEEELFQLAIEEHQQNAAYGLGSDQVYTPEGEVYFIYDEDAGL